MFISKFSSKIFGANFSNGKIKDSIFSARGMTHKGPRYATPSKMQLIRLVQLKTRRTE